MSDQMYSKSKQASLHGWHRVFWRLTDKRVNIKDPIGLYQFLLTFMYASGAVLLHELHI
jgi:hypothetical protein